MTATTVPAYAVGLISDARPTEELFTYMETVEATMRRFGGRWLSHGRSPEVREGALDGDLVVIKFPDLATARAWYESEEYQAVVPLRARNCHAVIAHLEGVGAEYSTRETIGRMREMVARKQ